MKPINEDIADKIDEHLDTLAKRKSLESYCNNCGDCCHPSVTAHGTNLLLKSLKCKYKTVNKSGESQCAVYQDRFKKAHWCQDLKGMLLKGIAPKSCPYVETLDGYKGAENLPQDIYKSLLPVLKASIGSGDLTPFSHTDLYEFFSK